MAERMKSMAGKKVLVTGSGTGIGSGIALEFARRGADVAVHYSHSAKGALQIVEEIRKMGFRSEAFQADFNRVEEVKNLGRQAVDFLGGMDILVNNAGITLNRPFQDVTVEQFDTLYHVNVRAQFFLTQTILPTMISAGKGAIVNITSIHAFLAMPEHAVYAGTKGAIVAYTRQLAIELAPKSIRVNAVAPGAVTVENHFKFMKNYDPNDLGRRIPAGFVADPPDIAGVVAFLASDEARYITGQTLIVDGGTTSVMSFNESFRRPSDASFGKGYVPGV